MADQDLTGKIVVITGASSGFGRGAAIKFAKAGASVVVSARREQVLDQVVRDCEAAGGRALAIPADVGNESDV